MDNEENKSRIKEFFDYLKSDEFRIKTISTCCVIMAALLLLIAGELYNIYKGIIAVTDLLEDGEYNRVVEVFDNEKTVEDIMPILDVISTTELTVENSENSDIKDNNDEVESTTKKTTQTNANSQTTNKTETTTKSNKTTTTTTTKPQLKIKTYVINKNSKKIHTEDCSFVDRMKEENKQVVQLTKEELNKYIDNGYTTCSSCGG